MTNVTENPPAAAEETLRPEVLMSPGSRPQASTIRRVINALSKIESQPPQDNTPWVLHQFFNGEIDLDVELAQRFPSMPVMPVVSFREMGSKSQRGVATLTTQDGGAQTLIDVDSASKVTQFSFTYGSMLTLRFRLGTLSDMDRTRWLDLMRREQGGLAFLWGPTRWEHDYLICVVRRYYTNLYAFSTNSFEAGIRLTPDTTKQILDWLEKMWKPAAPAEEPPALLTW